MTLEDITQILTEQRMLFIREPPPIRPSPGQALKMPKGRKTSGPVTPSALSRRQLSRLQSAQANEGGRPGSPRSPRLNGHVHGSGGAEKTSSGMGGEVPDGYFVPPILVPQSSHSYSSHGSHAGTPGPERKGAATFAWYDAKGNYVKPEEYVIRWDRQRVAAWMRDWEGKGYLRLRPEKLQWTPYAIVKGGPGASAATGLGLPGSMAAAANGALVGGVGGVMGGEGEVPAVKEAKEMNGTSEGGSSVANLFSSPADGDVDADAEGEDDDEEDLELPSARMRTRSPVKKKSPVKPATMPKKRGRKKKVDMEVERERERQKQEDDNSDLPTPVIAPPSSTGSLPTSASLPPPSLLDEDADGEAEDEDDEDAVMSAVTPRRATRGADMSLSTRMRKASARAVRNRVESESEEEEEQEEMEMSVTRSGKKLPPPASAKGRKKRRVTSPEKPKEVAGDVEDEHDEVEEMVQLPVAEESVAEPPPDSPEVSEQVNVDDAEMLHDEDADGEWEVDPEYE